MTAQEKLEKLTNAWYGFDLFSALVAFVFVNGIGLFSAIFGVMGLLFSWFVTYLIGRNLRRKSSLQRVVLLVFSSLFLVFGALGIGRALWVSEWTLSLLGYSAWSAIGVYMHAKSINVLTDKSVRAHFA